MAKKISVTKKALTTGLIKPSRMSKGGIIGITGVVFYVVFLQCFVGTEVQQAFTVSGKLKPEDAIRAMLFSLPDEVVDTVGLTAPPSKDFVSERRKKLEYLDMQEELIKDVGLKEMTVLTAREAQEQAIARALEKRDQLCEINCALAVLTSASFVPNMQSMSREREEFIGLVNKKIELYNSMVDKKGTDGEKDAIKAYRLQERKLTILVNAMLQNLEKEIDDVDAKIGDRWRVLDRDHDGEITPEEVAGAAQNLKDTLGKEGVQDENLLIRNKCFNLTI
ncbi:hypothetical protein GOBAR_DD12357 [Gossypium barbadense]|nr:hypothetical protein GOBAR_DD12357 [Gossypium barbadense]